MTAFDPRGSLAAAVALSLVGGLSACTAAPRYPVVEGEAPGGGIEPLQARYPVALALAAQGRGASQPAPAAPAPPRPEIAPRPAPSGEVSSTELPPPEGASTMDTSTTLSLAPPARAAEAPPSEPPAPAPSAPAPVTPAPVTPPSPSVAGLGPPRSAAASMEASSSAARGFIQRDGAGPGRFTLGAPVPPPVMAAPAGLSAPLVYARPSPSVAPSLARFVGGPGTSSASAASPYARPNLPPAAPAASPPRASVAAAAASAHGLPGGPRPYSSLFPQGPSSARGVRSAGIRSTPSDPGIAPQALSAAPDAPPPPLAGGEAAARGRGRFLWPLKGALLSGFGDKGGGVRNDGLNISAGLGDPVRAAAAGEVVYAGNQVPGSGNLVLVKHPGGWVTEYAHLSRIEVRNRDPVVQGQELGQAGQTGAVDRPQVHFEIRYAPSPEVKAVPIDPATLLPSG